MCSARASKACSAVIIPDVCHPEASFVLNSKSGGGGGALGGAWNSALAKKKLEDNQIFQRKNEGILSTLDSYKKSYKKK